MRFIDKIVIIFILLASVAIYLDFYMEWWKWVGLIFIAVIIYGIFEPPAQRKCAWCGSNNLKFIDGTPTEFFWKYANKDGSKNKVRKGNVQHACYKSSFECQICKAKTGFYHLADLAPNEHNIIWKRFLIEKGSSDRDEKKGTNWEDSSEKILKIAEDKAQRN